MNGHTRKALTWGAVALLLVGHPAAHAWPANLENLYIGGGVGWDYAADIRLDSNGAVMEFDQGVFQPSLALGMYRPNGWRLELERSTHNNSPEILYSSRAGVELDTDEADSIRATSLMLNLVREFRVGEALYPYVGIGIGRTEVDLRFSEPRYDDPPTRPRQDLIHDSDNALAWQGIVGFSVPVGRRFVLAADYRLWQSQKLDLEELSGADLNFTHRVHSVWMHVRYQPSGKLPMRLPERATQTLNGLYLSGSLGGVFAEDASVIDTDQGLDTEPVIDAFGVGPFTTLALGYGWRDRWRFEVEAGYRDSPIELFEQGAYAGEDAASGSLKLTTAMLNIVREFAPGSPLRPFVGVGIGAASADYSFRTKTFCLNRICGPVEERKEVVDDRATALAAQAILGVDVAVTQRLHLLADYRYLLMGKFKLNDPTGSPFTVHKQRVKSVSLTLRYAFAAIDG